MDKKKVGIVFLNNNIGYKYLYENFSSLNRFVEEYHFIYLDHIPKKNETIFLLMEYIKQSLTPFNVIDSVFIPSINNHLKDDSSYHEDLVFFDKDVSFYLFINNKFGHKFVKDAYLNNNPIYNY